MDFFIILCAQKVFQENLLPFTKFRKKYLDINVLFNYKNCIRNFFTKNMFKSSNCGGVYLIPCKNCENVYIGQTGRDIKKKIYEHKYCIRTCNEQSALYNHVLTNNHNIDFDKAKIVIKNSNFINRLMFESFLI